MANRKFEFKYGNGTMDIVIPEEQVINEVYGCSCEVISDVPAAVQKAIRNPINSAPLKELVKAGDKVAIMVSDITRAWVKFDQFLPVVLDELNQAGIPDQDIFITVAVGAHRLNTEEEFVSICGSEVCDRVTVSNHDCHNVELVYTGRTSRGIECYINKRVAEANVKILTGGIVYHFMAGFGGGRKSILPGISGLKAIQANHLLCMNEIIGQGLNPNTVSGILDINEMNEDMTEQAALAKPDFLLNAVFASDGKFAKFVAGHWNDAWLAGVKKVKEIYGVPISAKADLVIASAGGFPKDINLYQGLKTVDNPFMAAKPGGVIICFMELQDIMEPPEFADWFKYKTELEHEMALREQFSIPGYLAYKLADIARKGPLIIVSKPENADFIQSVGMIPAVTAQEAYDIAKDKIGRDSFTITLMPAAANTVPLLAE